MLLLKQEDIAHVGHPEGLSFSRQSGENSISVPYVIGIVTKMLDSHELYMSIQLRNLCWGGFSLLQKLCSGLTSEILWVMLTFHWVEF